MVLISKEEILNRKKKCKLKKNSPSFSNVNRNPVYLLLIPIISMINCEMVQKKKQV